MADKKTAVIIGAGPAGLTAAYKLLKDTDYSPIILEASGDIGGISKTVRYKGNGLDIGGHRFFSKNDEVNKMWFDIMALQGKPSFDDKVLDIEKPLSENGPDPEKEDNVMLIRNRISRIFFKKKFFDYPISMKPATFKNMGIADTAKAGFGYIGACIHKRPEDNLENFYINRFGKPLYEMFFEDYTTKLWGRHPSQISAEWGAQRVKGLSLWKTVTNILTKPFRKKNVETSLIEQYYYPKLGPGQYWEKVADDVVRMGGKIVLGAEVKDFDISDGKVRAVITSDGRRFEGDEFMSTMPVKDLVAGIKTAPDDIKRIAAGLPYRDFMTVGLLVNKLKLKNNTKHRTLTGDVPDCWIYVQERDVKIGRLQIFNNWSPYMTKDPEHTVWVGLEYFCNEGDDMWNMSDDDFISLAKKELSRIGVIDEKDVLDACRVKVKKAYPAYFDTYSEFDKVQSYLDGIENLWLLGRNGQHRYNNMDHSMLTAMEAVKEIASGGHDKRAVWNVNTEKEYHEEKTVESKNN